MQKTWQLGTNPLHWRDLTFSPTCWQKLWSLKMLTGRMQKLFYIMNLIRITSICIWVDIKFNSVAGISKTMHKHFQLAAYTFISLPRILFILSIKSYWTTTPHKHSPKIWSNRVNMQLSDKRDKWKKGGDYNIKWWASLERYGHYALENDYDIWKSQ